MTDAQNPDLVDLAQTLQRLDSEKVNSASDDLDTLSAFEIATLMNREDHKVAQAVAKVLPQVGLAIEAATKAIEAGGRIIYVGAGTSGRLGVLDASEVPPTFSAPPSLFVGLIAGGREAMFCAQEGIEDDTEQGMRDMASAKVDNRDFVVGLAASGRTPYVLAALTEAHNRGARTAGISCNRENAMDGIADISITPVVGPEVLSGSTRLKSGTAQKQILNMISTGAMVQIGKCYGNRMVDLKASNEKLKARAMNLVVQLTGANHDVALQTLTECAWNIKAAILVIRAGVSPQEAEHAVNSAGGHLRVALEHFQKA